ncbi:hypothetical protein TNCV_1206681 [Trichonephila clavipes]|nr:hypothetical protein TNCV_1206681 [Trichonephila clavipes]
MSSFIFDDFYNNYEENGFWRTRKQFPNLSSLVLPLSAYIPPVSQDPSHPNSFYLLFVGRLCRGPFDLLFVGRLCRGPFDILFGGRLCRGPFDLLFGGRLCRGPFDLLFGGRLSGVYFRQHCKFPEHAVITESSENESTMLRRLFLTVRTAWEKRVRISDHPVAKFFPSN